MNRRSGWRRGHVGGFNDPLMDCKACKARFRADKLIEDWAKANGEEIEADGWTNEQLESFIEEKQIPCPTCGKHDFTGIRKFNMMFKTLQGVTEDASNEIYLRPETAQGIFVNFPNVAAHHPQKAAVRRMPGGQDPSATRSRRATSSSASASSSRWSLSSSASRARIWSGSAIGAATATSGC